MISWNFDDLFVGGRNCFSEGSITISQYLAAVLHGSCMRNGPLWYYPHIYLNLRIFPKPVDSKKTVMAACPLVQSTFPKLSLRSTAASPGGFGGLVL